MGWSFAAPRALDVRALIGDSGRCGETCPATGLGRSLHYVESGGKVPAYVIANVRVENPEGYEEYRRRVPESISRFGGRYLARGGKAEVLEGEAVLGRVVVLEFPTYEAIESWYGSAEYEELRRIRRACSLSDVMIVEGT